MNAIVSALVNGAVVSGLLTVAVWLGLRVAPQHTLNAATRYIVWWVALAIAVLSPVWYLPRPHFDGYALHAVPAADVQLDAGPIVVVRGAPPATEPPSRRLQLPLALPSGRWPQWLAAAWMSVTVLMLLRLAVSCLALHTRKTRAGEAPSHLAARMEAWLLQCGSARGGVRIAVTAGVPAPMVAGLWRPAIVIPARLVAELPDADLDLIGLHETAHLVRRDDYALIVERLIEALFALHPVVRWIAGRIDLEREIACDDFVVEATASPRPFAACLTRVAELTGGVRSPLVAAAAADERSHLTRRIDMLLDKTRHTSTRLLKARLATIVAALAALAFVAARGPGIVALAMPAPLAAAAPAPVPAPPPIEAPEPAPTPATPLPAVTAAPEADLAPAAEPQSQEPFSVVVPVVVEDPQHRVVTGLEKDDFHLFEDGVEQHISRFSTTNTPVSIGLVLDSSGSMRAKFQPVQQALWQFMQFPVGPEDEMFVVKFNDEPELLTGYTRDFAGIQNQLAQVQPAGGTALWDALNLAVHQSRTSNRPHRAILVITDTGGDNSSQHTARAMASLLQEADVSLYVVSIGREPTRESRRLIDFTTQVGGQFIADSLENLPIVLARVGRELHNSYILEYTPKNTLHDGTHRFLRIEVTAPRGLPPLFKKHRAGYFAPDK